MVFAIRQKGKQMKVIIDGIEYVPKPEIKVGDTVVVTDSGQVFPTFDTWHGWKTAPIECVVRAQYGMTEEKIDGHRAKVVHIGAEPPNYTLAVIEMEDNRKCYLIDIIGLKKVKESNEQ